MNLRALSAWLSRAAKDIVPRLEQRYRALVMPYWRMQAMRQKAKYCGRYVAVTGSCGKTTTTSVIGHLLGKQGDARVGILANTERHALRAMRKLTAPVGYFAQEMSEFPLGGLRSMGQALRPDVVVVTSIGLDHLVAFRTVERVAEEMAPLVASVPPDGIVCLNADDPQCAGLARHSAARVIRFGRAADADLRIENVQSELPGRLRFDVVVGDRRWPVQTRFAGTLMLTNLAGALATVHGLGLDVDRAIADLAKLEPLKQRMQVVEDPGGHTYVFDTVKASLWSTKLLAEDLPNIFTGRRVLVLGELSDGGSDSNRKIRQFFRKLAEGNDLVIGVAESERHASKVKAIYPGLNVKAARSVEHLAELLAEEPPSLVIVKGTDLAIRPEHLPGTSQQAVPSAALQTVALSP